MGEVVITIGQFYWRLITKGRFRNGTHNNVKKSFKTRLLFNIDFNCCSCCLLSLMCWVWLSLCWCVLGTSLCNKVYLWLVIGRWFPSGTLVSSSNKNDHCYVIEILLKMAFNTHNNLKLIIVCNLSYFFLDDRNRSNLLWNLWRPCWCWCCCYDIKTFT